MMKTLAAVVLVATLVIWGVYLGLRGPDWLVSTRKDNIRPSDIDFPVRNVHPIQVLQVWGVMPQTLQLQFLLYYSAVVNAPYTARSGNYCGYKQDAESSPAFSVTEPLEIVHSGNHFQASVIVDKYLPGRCKWHLDSIGYAVLNGVGPLAQDWIGIVYNAERVINCSLRGNRPAGIR